MKAKLTLAISVILLAALSPQGMGRTKAQSAAAPDRPSTTHTGKLQGRITNTSSEAVKDVTVVLTDTSTHEKSQTKTDGAGGYTFNELFPGLYSVSVEAKGYKPASAEARVKNGKVETVNLQLTSE